jgi:septum formation protein
VDESSNSFNGASNKQAIEVVPMSALASGAPLSTRLFRLALILASSSPIRRQMLNAAGVEFEVQPPRVDEGAFKTLLGDNEPHEIASTLAASKAVSVSRSCGNNWVIGSDSVVSVEGRRFDKPEDRNGAAEHLRYFSGRAMQLSSSVALACSGNPSWTHTETATLQFRLLSDAFIQSYLDAEWPDVGYCVGVFRMEGRGVQLFDSIEGDHFTILGMPLIPLLGALRERGLLLE